ncbi:MAG: 4Fe-4S dicluster domain-containing protein [Methanosphaera stadtmanae]|nr:4Fe-4S dicluster domain-containing protein [Methanosphaera stadtmanae]
MNDFKLGFGFMRLPIINGDVSQIDYNKVNTLVDYYIENGGRYFDTGFNYHNGKSEEAIKKCVIDRYSRDEVLIADKMPIYGMTINDNPENIFQTQLERCGLDYFDYYLVHNTSDLFYNGVCKQLNVFDYLREFKKEGLINKLGISHHGTPEALNQVLTENQDIEFVQLQINYVDWKNDAVQAKKCYEIVKDNGLDVFVMEPLKGGNLVNVPEKVEKLFQSYNQKSPVNWALSYVLNLSSVALVLSGMSDLKELQENMSIVKDFKTMNNDELEIIKQARDIINDSIEIPCTYCDYCFKYCPKQIPISKYFSIFNDEKQSKVDQMLNYLYYDNYAEKFTKASSCVKCGACEKVCPQQINITEELEKVVNLFEK